MDLSIGVLMGMGTLVLWGVGDFYAALLCRRHGIQRTLIWTQILALGAASLLPLVWFLCDPNFYFQFPLKLLWNLAWLGAIQAVSYVAFYKGLGEGVVSVVSPISASWSLIAVLWGWLVWQELLEGRQYAGVVVIIIGVFLTALEPAQVRELTGKQLAKGAAEGFLAMLLWGISFTLLVPMVREFGWYLPSMLMRLWAFLFLILFFALFPQFLRTPRIVKPPLLAFLGVAACDIGGVFFYGEGVRQGLASVVAPVSAAFPLITILLAAAQFQEKLFLSQKIGIAATLAGLILL